MSTIRKSLDILYYTFVLTLLLGIVALDILHWPVWNKDWHFSFSTSLEQFYIKTYNDPLSANLPVPNGWQNGMYFCEQLHLPFLLYYLFGKDGIKKELGSIVVFTQIAVAVSFCLWEIAAFEESVVSSEQKWTLAQFYVPFGLVPVVMVADMILRVHKRVEIVEQLKRK